MIYFALIAIFASIFGLLIYRYNGGKQIFRLDFVQFMYLAVFSPLLFVWAKSFLFFVLRSELSFNLSINELFIIDTIFSVLCFFTFSSVAIHSLTKTFWLKRRSNPKFDLYYLSEYFHLWWSHIVMFLGGMILIVFISMANLYAPFVGIYSKTQLYSTIAAGLFMGLISFYIIWNSDPGQGGFMRIMKMASGLFFSLHVVLYFIFEPSFKQEYAAFWLAMSMFLSLTMCSAVFEKSEKAESIRDWFLHAGWGDNINIFKKIK